MDTALRQFAQQVIDAEASAVQGLSAALDDTFEKAVRLVLDCPGSVLVSGIGKAGHVARKLSASFSSTGTPSHFLNPAEALHGDVGSVRKGDVVIVLSYSGESDEIVRMLSVIKKLGNPIVAITGHGQNTLARHSELVLRLGRIEEACPLGLAPSASTTAMAALGDALFLTVMKCRRFTADDFAMFHPAGQLGRRLIKVREAMTFKRGENLPLASDRLTVGQVLREVSSLKRRSGAVILTDEQTGRITGIFSDGDLRRLILHDEDAALRRPVREVMTPNPKRIRGDALASEAMGILRQHRIDDLPVVDEDDRPIGLIDVQDLVVLKLFDVEP